jgi:hypothetical protein
MLQTICQPDYLIEYKYTNNILIMQIILLFFLYPGHCLFAALLFHPLV